jgi:hypothetical protein
VTVFEVCSGENEIARVYHRLRLALRSVVDAIGFLRHVSSRHTADC